MRAITVGLICDDSVYTGEGQVKERIMTGHPVGLQGTCVLALLIQRNEHTSHACSCMHYVDTCTRKLYVPKFTEPSVSWWEAMHLYTHVQMGDK